MELKRENVTKEEISGGESPVGEQEKPDKTSLESFREEIRLKKEEEKWLEDKEGEERTAHFADINPDYLGKEEMEMYNDYKEGKLTPDKFRQCQKRIIECL